MLEEIRTELEETAKIGCIKSRTAELDTCLTWISGELDGCDLDDRQQKIVRNLRKTYLREFIHSLSTYGNSGYEEASPLESLVVNHIHLFVELDKEDPYLLKKIRPFFKCIDSEK